MYSRKSWRIWVVKWLRSIRASQIEAARKLGLNAFAISGEDLQYNEEFDAVFSNAVLHWIQRADVMLAACIVP